ncbi:ABC transporter permease [Verminephrobacter eiseniae]|uniref:ABC transporter permease n=1 Tax=Verminephrobacter eiseniae TaxID=364317 RepID=UPI0010F15F68|nr:ABC transporter permease [Verminephrobacter eiseniae]KAB7619422.1 ABC transporter permease [Verminephrobacter sp. Larva24]MCW5232593.1 ABC transporter permease [Verminephrobacter eiseniae]MCW5295842.1 ABC transporter permease [Verminephrobacter eiseniae]MCW8185101.1 ABC transporter permease [Verminephrobacter eiseniae]MCW8222826.1 ABC transporter permease [Verminephrobacter eiseniae]
MQMPRIAPPALRRFSQRWGQSLLLAPTLATLGLFMVLPMLWVAVMSLLEAAPYGGVRWGHWTTDAYLRFFMELDLDGHWVLNTDYMLIFSRSFGLALAVVVITLGVGFPLALHIALQEESKRNHMLLWITIPFWVNLLVRTYAWILLLRNGGVIEQSLNLVGFQTGGLNILYTPLATGIGLVYAYLPFMVLPIYTSLEKMDWRLFEAALDLGATRWMALRRIVIPLAMPGIVAGCLLVFIPALGAYYIPELLGGGKQMMIGSLIQSQFGVARNWPFGSALAFALLSIVLAGMLLYTRRFKKALDT